MMICDSTSSVTLPLPCLNKKGKKKKRFGKRLFPTKLYEILEEVDELGLSDAVSWLPHGQAFFIKDVDIFLTKVIPRCFKTRKIRSFHRQLHIWGFHRIPEGCDVGAWWHPSFIRGYPQNIEHIVRSQIKGEASQIPDVTSFYYCKQFYSKETKSTTATKSSGDEKDFECVDEEHGSLLKVCDPVCTIPQLVRPSNLTNTQITPVKRKEIHPKKILTAKYRLQTDEANKFCLPCATDSCCFSPLLENCISNEDSVAMAVHEQDHCASTDGGTVNLDEFSMFIDRMVQQLP